LSPIGLNAWYFVEGVCNIFETFCAHKAHVSVVYKILGFSISSGLVGADR